MQIFGTDISTEALDVARTGRYIENITRNVSPQRLERFFTRDGQYYNINKSVRDVCTFARHDVVIDPPFSRMNLVSCRNLLIYLSAAAQRSVMPLFHYALKPDGVLMLGPSETVGAFSELFGVIDNERSRLYSKKPRLSSPTEFQLSPRLAPRSSTQSSDRPENRMSSSEPSLIRSEMDRITVARYSPSCVLCDDELNIVEYRGDTSAFLVNPSGPPIVNLQRLARPEVFLAISDAIKQVRQEGVPVRKTGLQTLRGERGETASLEVHPVQTAATEGRWFLIFFEGGLPQVKETARARQPVKSLFIQSLRLRLGRESAEPRSDPRDEKIARQDAELDAMRKQLRTMLEEHESAREELKSSEEELLSSNEEFQSTNEELETAKEELQSLNEELSTTNDELRYRNHELKILHDRVTRARDYADAIIDTISESLLVLEPNFRVTRANKAFYETFLTNPEETLGTQLYSLGNGQWNIPALRELLETLLPQQAVVRDFRVTHDFQDIGVRSMGLNAARIVGQADDLIVLTIDDMTQRQLAMDQLEAADHQKDEFLAMLAHELRNPLATISNGLEIWERGDLDPATEALARAAAKRQLRHEIGLVDDLLDVSRITRGIIKLNVKPVNFVEVVQHAVMALQSDVEAHQHDVMLALPEQPLLIQGDAMRLEQIVINLLGNAIKYTPPGGHIAVSLVRDEENVMLSIVDNGIGMTADFLPSIFAIFVQAERSLDRKSAGLGLGLALVDRLVRLHHGTVHASSEGLGRGSKFVLRFPAMSDQAFSEQGLPAAQEQPLPAIGAPQRILVVDDNADAAESTAMLLALDGHDVEVAGDGPSALVMAKKFRPRVILLDIGLPDMDGYEVARQLRAMPQFTETMLIAHSGYADEEHVHRSKQAGFDHHLVKPVDMAQLNELIIRASKPSNISASS